MVTWSQSICHPFWMPTTMQWPILVPSFKCNLNDTPGIRSWGWGLPLLRFQALKLRHARFVEVDASAVNLHAHIDVAIRGAFRKSWHTVPILRAADECSNLPFLWWCSTVPHWPLEKWELAHFLPISCVFSARTLSLEWKHAWGANCRWLYFTTSSKKGNFPTT